MVFKEPANLLHFFFSRVDDTKNLKKPNQNNQPPDSDPHITSHKEDKGRQRAGGTWYSSEYFRN